MKELIEYIAQSLVDRPEEVKVTEVRRDQSVVLQLRVGREDMGRVIGKQGRIVHAMRVLLRVAAAREGKHASLEIR